MDVTPLCKSFSPFVDIRDHLSGKPGNVREFDGCHGNGWNFTKNQESVGEKSCQGKVA